MFFVGGVVFSRNVRVRGLSFPFLASSQPHCAISRHCLMQSSSLNANQALNRIRIDTCENDEMPTGQPARDTVGMHVSGLRGSLEHTMDRKRQLDRKFAYYYSQSFARIIGVQLIPMPVWDNQWPWQTPGICCNFQLLVESQ